MGRSEHEFVSDEAKALYDRTLLTRRQADVLTLQRQGLDVPEIATELGIQSTTVRLHLSNLDERYEKAARTVLESDIIAHPLKTGSGTRMMVDLVDLLGDADE